MEKENRDRKLQTKSKEEGKFRPEKTRRYLYTVEPYVKVIGFKEPVRLI